MIVDCAVYRQGHRRPGISSISEALAAARTDEESFVWLGLADPTGGEFAEVAEEFGLHPLAIEDAVNAHQRAKLEHYGDSLFLVLKPLRYLEDTSDIETGELMLFLGDGFAVTVRHGEANPLSEVRRRLETQPELLAAGPAAVLYAVADAVVDTYVLIADEVERDLEGLEARVFSTERTQDTEMIYSLKREVLEFRRAVIPLAEPMRRLAEDHLPGVDPAMRPYLRDVSDHVYRVAEQVEAADRLLTDIFSANLAQVSVRQNDDMRRISAWVAIAAVPTVVGAIYGMNFKHMPELGWRLSYPGVLTITALACLLLYRAFRRSGWL